MKIISSLITLIVGFLLFAYSEQLNLNSNYNAKVDTTDIVDKLNNIDTDNIINDEIF